MAGSGRPKSSNVWNYFTYDKGTDKTTCTVLHADSIDTVWGKECKGQFAKNLKKHLKSCHDAQYKCFEIAEAKKRKKKRTEVHVVSLPKTTLKQGNLHYLKTTF